MRGSVLVTLFAILPLHTVAEEPVQNIPHPATSPTAAESPSTEDSKAPETLSTDEVVATVEPPQDLSLSEENNSIKLVTDDEKDAPQLTVGNGLYWFLAVF